MDQQEYDGPDVELAASVDEEDSQFKTSAINTKRFHQLTATRLAHTEEQQWNRRYKWNVVRDGDILQRKIELQSEQRRIDLTSLRRLTSPSEGQGTEPTLIESQQLHAKRMSSLPSKVTTITEQGDSRENRKESFSDQLLQDKNDVSPHIAIPQPYPLLSSTNTLAVHALLELGRRHSSLSSRGPSSMTLNRIQSDLDGEYEGVPRSSPVSTIGTFAQSPEPFEDPEIKSITLVNSSPHQSSNDSYLVNLVHLMEGKPLPPPPPTRNDIQMTAILADGTDGSSLSSLENSVLPKVSQSKPPKQILLLVIFIGTNLLFWCALSHPESFDLAREYISETFHMKIKNCTQRKSYSENLTFVLLSPDSLKHDIVDHGASSQDTILAKLRPEFFNEQSDPQMTKLNDICENAVKKEGEFWRPTRVGGPFYASMIRSVPTELPSKIESCFWVHMHPKQCIVVEDSYCTPVMGGWNAILKLTPESLQLPILEIVDKNMFNGYDDEFNQVPLMDVVGNFFRERRRKRIMNKKKQKAMNAF